MTDDQIIEFIQNNIDYLVTNSIINSMFRSIGWAIVKLLQNLIDTCKFMYDYTFGLIDITSWPVLEEWLKEYQPLLSAIMILSLVILGFMYMSGIGRKHNVFTNILIFAVVVTSSNYLFTQFNSWAIAFKDAVVDTQNSTDGVELIRINLYDLLYIDHEIGLKNMGDGNRPQYTSLEEAEVDYISINEVLDPDDLTDSDTKKILGNRLVFESGGRSRLEECYNGLAWTSYGNDFYYRYKFHYGTYFLNALALIIILICLSYKNLRIIYEIATSRILATIHAADLSTKKKIVKILEAIRDGYFALCYTAISLKVYFFFTDYINQNSQFSGTLRGIVILMLAFCVIDGANVMEKITGVDAGLSSMTGKLLASGHMLQSSLMGAQMIAQMRMIHNQNKLMEGTKGNQRSNLSGSASGSGKENMAGSISGSGRENMAGSMSGSGRENMPGSASENGRENMPGSASGNGRENMTGSASGSGRATMSGSASESRTGGTQYKSGNKKENMPGMGNEGVWGQNSGKSGTAKAGQELHGEEKFPETGGDNSKQDISGINSEREAADDAFVSGSLEPGWGTIPEDGADHINPDGNGMMNADAGEEPERSTIEPSKDPYGQAAMDMEQMNQDLQGMQGETGKQKYQNTGDQNGYSSGVEKTQNYSETGMFQKWERKGTSMSSAENNMEKFGTEQGKKKGRYDDLQTASTERSKGSSKKSDDANETFSRTARMNYSSKNENPDPMGNVAKITEERIGKDHYVGGEAVNTKKQKNTKRGKKSREKE